MPGPGPGSQQEQNLRAAVTPHGVALVGLEAGQGPGRSLDLVAAGPERDRALDDHDPRVLLHLVVTERLAGIEADEHRAGLVVAFQDDGRAAPARGVDLRELPGLHRAGVYRPRR